MRGLFLTLLASLSCTVSLFAGIIPDKPARAPAFGTSLSDPLSKSPFQSPVSERSEVTASLERIDRLFQSGETAKAESALLALASEKPKEPAPHVALARLYYSQKQFPRARASLEQALSIQESVPLRLDLATVYSEGLADPAKALEHATKAAQNDPAHAGAQNALGWLFVRMGDHSNAATAFRRSIQLDPAQGSSRRGLAEALVQQRKFAEALAQLQEAAKIAPQEAGILLELGDVRQVQGQSAEAGAAYRKATDLAPQNAFVWAKLGMYHHAQAQWSEADAAYARAITLSPASGMILNNRAALVLEGYGEPKAALSWAREAVRTEPDNPHYLDTLGQILVVSGEATEAETVLRRAMAIAPDQRAVRLHLAQALALKPAGKAEALRLTEGLIAEKDSPERGAAEKLRAKLSGK